MYPSCDIPTPVSRLSSPLSQPQSASCSGSLASSLAGPLADSLLGLLPAWDFVRSPESPDPSASLPKLPLLPLMVSVTTLPCLGLILGTRWLQPQSQQWGLWSEALFRGERLPILPLRSQ